MPGFLSSRPNWIPRPLTRKRVLPPLWSQGGDTLACGIDRGRGEPIRKKEQTVWYSRYSIISLRTNVTILLLSYLTLFRRKIGSGSMFVAVSKHGTSIISVSEMCSVHYGYVTNSYNS